jgi:hypothetical protein
VVPRPVAGGGASLIDVTNTRFARDGIRQARFDNQAVDPRYPAAHKVSGHYWLAEIVSHSLVAPAHSPALQKLFAILAPPPALPPEGHDDGPPRVEEGIRNPQQANPDLRVEPGENVMGDLPVHEAGALTLGQLAQQLRGLDPMVQRALTVAFVKQTMGDDGESIISGLTSPTESTTRSGGSGRTTGDRSTPGAGADRQRPPAAPNQGDNGYDGGDAPDDEE